MRPIDVQEQLESLQDENKRLVVQNEEKDGEYCDFLLKELCRRESIEPVSCRFKPVKVLKGHISKVYSLSWSESGLYLVSSSEDGRLIVWNAETSSKLATASTNFSCAMTCCYSPHTDLIASGGLDNICTIFSFQPGSSDTLRTMGKLIGHSGYVSDIRFLNNETLLSSSGDRTCIAWDVSKERSLASFSEHTDDIMCIDTKPKDYNIFASGSCDRRLKIWDRRVSSSVDTFLAHQSDINTVRFFPDGNAVATGSDDCSSKIFDLRYNGKIATYTNGSRNGRVVAVDFSKSGRLLFSALDTNKFVVWDILSPNAVCAINTKNGRTGCLEVSPNGYGLGVGTWDGLIKIWSVL